MDLEADDWLRLAREDPEAFEREREAAIEALIASTPPGVQNRLRSLQCRIDLERRRAKTPLGAAIRLHGLMWERFENLRAALHAVSDAGPTLVQAAQRERQTPPAAAVIPFARPRASEAPAPPRTQPPPG